MTVNTDVNRFYSLLLAITHIASAVTLLALSAWFIAACAIAGHAGVLAGFNYVIPSAAIRFIAIIRIASGYFEKYSSHISLLNHLKEVRHHLLKSILTGESQQTLDTSARTLHQDSELWAGRWAALHNPIISSLATILGLTLAFSILVPESLVWWFSLLIVLLVLSLIYIKINSSLERQVSHAQSNYFNQQYQWLSATTLWHLKPEWKNGQEIINTAATASRLQNQQKLVTGIFELAIISAGISWSTWLAYHIQFNASPSALWAIPIVLVASIRDWFSPVITASAQLAPIKLAGVRIQNITETTTSHEETRTTKPSNKFNLRLTNFQWLREKTQGTPLTFHFEQPGIYLLKSPSGRGKSSLLLSLSQQIPYQGQCQFAEQELNCLKPDQLGRLIHHAEQFAHVFSDTLAENLLIAKPDATPDELVSALYWVGLTQWANAESLKIWLGPEGRPISGGEQKRLTLARAYLSDAPFWLLDEPFESLDSESINQLADKLNIEANKRIIVLASHNTPVNLSVSQCIKL